MRSTQASLPPYLQKPASQYKLEKARQKTQQHATGRDWRDDIVLNTPHAKQLEFLTSPAKRKIIRAGRRGGKTTGIAIDALEDFKAGRRVLYAAPTQEQIDTFWREVKTALQKPIEDGVLYKNETLHIIEVPNTLNRIRAKTAWDAETLRGDYADKLILDEFQLMAEDTWERVGQPMLLDNNGDAVFIYTPPSLHSNFRTRARDPQNAAKMFKRARADTTGLWAAFHFTSHDNPFISTEALAILASDMTALAFEQEIMAEDKDEAPGALWKRDTIHEVTSFPDLVRVVVGVDPPGGRTECGIVVAGLGDDGHVYVLADNSLQDSPAGWAREVIATYNRHRADRIVGEKNFGGDMVEHTIRTAEGGDVVSYKNVDASRGKALRAEPVAAQYEHRMVHHVGKFPHLEDEMCSWVPGQGMSSPNRMDALVWTVAELMSGLSIAPFSLEVNW